MKQKSELRAFQAKLQREEAKRRWKTFFKVGKFLRQNLRKTQNLTKSFLSIIYDKNDHTSLNLVTQTVFDRKKSRKDEIYTQFSCAFLLLQASRLIFFLILLFVLVLEIYIYAKSCVFQLNFYALLFTELAMIFLLKGSGTQKVY